MPDWKFPFRPGYSAAGRVVGSGLGIRYSYVDFALSNVDHAISVVGGVARRVGLPERSWLLFFDSALVHALDWHALFAPTRTLRVDVTATRAPVKSLEFATLRVKAVFDSSQRSSPRNALANRPDPSSIGLPSVSRTNE